MKIIYLLPLTFVLTIFCNPAYSQLNRLRNKIENKAEDAAIDALFGKKKDNNTSSSDGNSEYSEDENSSGSRNRARNTGGAGLTTTPPDVNKYLTEAEASYATSSYGKARSALQQAMLGVEMEIGHQILNSLPESINGLNKEESSDQVASAGYGWAGLTIQRIFTNGDDKEFQVLVANNSVMLSAVNLYLLNGGYSQSSGEQQNWKQTTLKGHKAVISYDEYDGYKLSVPIGQTSLINFEAINFANEDEVMQAAEKIDIDGIMKKLGEQ